MSAGRTARRRAERARKAAGAALVTRAVVPLIDAIAPEEALGAYVAETVKALMEAGADLDRGRVVVTVGRDHPDFPGQTVIEAKASAKKAADPCDCPVDHAEPEDG